MAQRLYFVEIEYNIDLQVEIVAGEAMWTTNDGNFRLTRAAFNRNRNRRMEFGIQATTLSSELPKTRPGGAIIEAQLTAPNAPSLKAAGLADFSGTQWLSHQLMPIDEANPLVHAMGADGDVQGSIYRCLVNVYSSPVADHWKQIKALVDFIFYPEEESERRINRSIAGYFRWRASEATLLDSAPDGYTVGAFVNNGNGGGDH